MSDAKWISDFNDLTGPETDRCFEMLGVSADQLDRHAFSLACAVAIVTRQRTDPDVPDETWQTLKIRDLDMVSVIDADDVSDPT